MNAEQLAIFNQMVEKAKQLPKAELMNQIVNDVKNAKLPDIVFNALQAAFDTMANDADYAELDRLTA